MFVQTKAALIKQNVPHQEVIHESYKKKAKEKPCLNRVMEDPSKVDEDATPMKKLRLDVMKFASTGFSQRKKKMTKEAILVELGAKPAKKKCHNYKDLKIMRKRRIQEIKNRDEVLERCKQPALTKKVSRKNVMKSSVKKYKDDNILGKWGSVKKNK